MKSIILTFVVTINPAASATRDNTIKYDPVQVNKWNNFVAELYELHLNQTKKVPITTSEATGGYGGGFANKNFYLDCPILIKIQIN